MIIKDLWILSNTGTYFYHYKAPFSTFQVDNLMFTGFISALSSFAESLVNESIEFLKMQNDELYFTRIEEIILVAIISTEGAEQEAVNQILNFIGSQFLDKYGEDIHIPIHSWDEMAEEFTQEIEFICSDESIYEELKREMLNKLIVDVVEGKIQPNQLYWKISQMLANSNVEMAIKSVELLKNLQNLLPSITNDVIIESQIKEIIQKCISGLSFVKPKERSQLLVICDDKTIFENIYFKFLSKNILCIYFPSTKQLLKALETWNSQIKYNILIVTFSFMEYELYNIFRHKLQAGVRIFIWSLYVPERVREIIKETKNIEITCYDCNDCLKSGECHTITKILSELENKQETTINNNIELTVSEIE